MFLPNDFEFHCKSEKVNAVVGHEFIRWEVLDLFETNTFKIRKA